LFVSSCSVQDPSKANIIYLTNLVNLTMLTFGVNNILTGLTLVFLFRSRNKFNASSHTHTNPSHTVTAHRDRKFAINSVVLDLICFVCKTPLLVCLACSTYLNFPPEEMNMLFTIGVCIYTIENAQSFFTNYFVNSIFHAEFAALVCSHVGSHSVSSTSQTLKNERSKPTPSTKASEGRKKTVLIESNV
jgi:hypothetical protein